MRKLNNAFHIEGEQLIKTSNNTIVPLDEPLFIMRGRDALALATLYFYRQLAEADNCTPYFMDLLAQTLAEFATFRMEHPERMKQPGCTMGK